MSKFRKFTVISVDVLQGSPGPDRLWTINYTAIVNKQWVNNRLFIVARNATEAKNRAIERFS